jgi:hypothetical protein
MEKISNFDKHMAFNGLVRPGKIFKIYKGSAYVYSGL